MDAQDKKFKAKIKKLNEAYVMITEASKMIEQNVEPTNDMNTYLWRFAKAFKEVNREVLKQLKKQNLDDEFKRIIKNLE